MNSPSIKNSYDPQWSISSIWFSLHFQDVKITAKKGRKSSPVFASGVTAEVQRSAEQFCSHHGRGVDSFSDSERKLVSGALVTAMRRAFDVLRALLTGQEPDRAAERPKQPPWYPPPPCSLKKAFSASRRLENTRFECRRLVSPPTSSRRTGPLRLWHLPTGTPPCWPCDEVHPPRSPLRPGRAYERFITAFELRVSILHRPCCATRFILHVTLSQHLSAAGRSLPDGLGERRGPAAGGLAYLAAAGEGGVEDDLRTRVRGRGDMGASGQARRRRRTCGQARPRTWWRERARDARARARARTLAR